MTKFLRKNAWNQGGTFNNSDLLWYAKGVGVMQSRALDDKNSWWFFAAIHGVELEEWKSISYPPQVPTTPVPSQSVQLEFWNQCQHQSWYFPPWHRGYLIALEQQIRSVIISLGGPNDWSLPYWNYFGPDNQYKIPPAFTQPNLPDGTPNPLFVSARYGPNNDGNVYIVKTTDNTLPLTYRVSEKCQEDTKYTGSDARTLLPGYGGPVTKFNWSGGVSGNLEANPHNWVHMHVGGFERSGLMSDPSTAALDAIFYLHHCNIDRMWVSWNESGNSNPQEENWLNGPAALGQRKFIMPLPSGNTWIYAPKDLNSLSQLNYNYEEISAIPQLTSMFELRLKKFNMPNINLLIEKNMDLGSNSELVGASETLLQLEGNRTIQTRVVFGNSWKKVQKSFVEISESNLPNQVYLQLEEVKGGMDANVLTVSVNGQEAGSFPLFGLRNASKSDGHHGGMGLTFLLDITNIIDDLHLDNTSNFNAPLDISISPNTTIPDGQKISVGRVSIYRVK